LIDIKHGKLRKKRKSIMVSVCGVGHKRLMINVTLQINYKNKFVRAYKHVNNEFKIK